MKVYAIDYVVGNTYKVKRIKAETVEQAIKKARLGKSIVDINTEEERTIMQYKKAESQGAYIDRLRVKYPFCICRKSEPSRTERCTAFTGRSRSANLPFSRW